MIKKIQKFSRKYGGIIEDLQKTYKINNKKYEALLNNIEKLVNTARSNVSYTINNTMVETYWNIGKYIIEFEQDVM